MDGGLSAQTRTPLIPDCHFNNPQDEHFNYLDDKLRNVDSGDGRKYRGRGIKHLTGRENYAKYRPDQEDIEDNFGHPMNTIRYALGSIAASLLFSGMAAADSISFHDGLEVLVPAHSADTHSVNGGTCIDASGHSFALRICLYRRSFEDMAASNMFFEYRSLSDDEKELAGPLPEDSYVVSAGNWLHPTSKKVSTHFQYYEAVGVLCNLGASLPEPTYRDCYFAGMKPLLNLATPLSIFVSSGYPVTESKKLQTQKIREAINSIQIRKPSALIDSQQEK